MKIKKKHKQKQPKQIKGDQERSRKVKPVLISIASAVVIGSLLGVIMLNMFKSIDDDNVSVSGNAVSEVKNDSDKDTGASVKLGELTAYVLQAGAFAEEANAIEWGKTYEQAGFQTETWQKDDQYFLLVDIAATKESAMELAAELEQQGFDIYIKEWTTSSSESSFAKEESDWLASFEKHWNTVLSAEDGIEVEGWRALMDSHPLKADNFAPLIESVDNLLKEETEERIALLTIWQAYEQALK